MNNKERIGGSMKKLLFVLLTICLVANEGWTASKTEDYELQEKCARRAKERFKEEFDFMHYAYQNHYNKKMNKCFMWVWSLDGARVQYLYDVNEKQDYGMIMIRDNDFRCRILKKSCNSEGEWDAFIKPYMEE
jgi:hypothetical protein